MSKPATKVKFIQGAFLKKVWEDKTDPGNILISYGIKKDAYIKEIQALQADARGFVNLSIGRQRVDKNKWSLWLDEYVRNTPQPEQQTPAQRDPLGPSGPSSLGTGPADPDLPF